MRSRFAALLITTLALAAACTSSGEPPADAELWQAIDDAINDCQDPLHDSDGSGGFFAFCERVDNAIRADRLDCLRSSGDDTTTGECEAWTLNRGQVPPQYFDPTPIAVEVQGESPTAAPAGEAPLVIDDATGLPIDMVILEWAEFGGCAMAGNFCNSYIVFGDGRVEGSQGGTLRATGSVDSDLVRALVDSADIDTAALVASLPAGPCDAAVDGISHRVWIGPADLELDSCEVDLSGDEPLIAAVRGMGLAAEQAALID